MNVFIDNIEIEVTRVNSNTILLQPRFKEIDENFVYNKVIPEIGKRYGTIEDKLNKIEKLLKQIDEIELSLLAINKKVKIRILKSDECPF